VKVKAISPAKEEKAKFMIIDGNHRFVAPQTLGLNTIPYE